MHRFYCARAIFDTPVIRLDDPCEIHHMLHVLRLKKGARVCVFNGLGQEAEGWLLAVNQHAADIQIELVRTATPDPCPEMILACAIPKKAKFESIIEKCTELGVDGIVPLLTERTEVRVDATRGKHKLQRFQNVAVNAAKQCGRLTVPVIGPITKFPDFLSGAGSGNTLLIPCLEGTRRRLADCLPGGLLTKKIIFMIGPEGDFTSDELALAMKNGSQPVSLGSTTLKVDTAAVAVIAFTRLLLCQQPS